MFTPLPADLYMMMDHICFTLCVCVWSVHIYSLFWQAKARRRKQKNVPSERDVSDRTTCCGQTALLLLLKDISTFLSPSASAISSVSQDIAAEGMQWFKCLVAAMRGHDPVSARTLLWMHSVALLPFFLLQSCAYLQMLSIFILDCMTLWGAPDKRAYIQAFRSTVCMKNEGKQTKGKNLCFCLLKREKICSWATRVSLGIL